MNETKPHIISNMGEITNKSSFTQTYKQWIYAILTNFTMLTYGMLGGWVSPMTKILQSPVSPMGYPLSDYEISWIASVLSMSAVFGVWLFSIVADAYGRKCGLLLISVLQTICCIGTIFARSGLSLIIARVFCGVASAGCYSVVPMYIKEISDDNVRGPLLSFFTLFQNMGFLIIFAMGAYLDYYLVIYILTTVSVVTGLCLLTIPESPPFLIKLKKYEQAAKTIAHLKNLDTQDFIKNELECMKDKANESKTLPNVSFFSLFKNSGFRRGFIYSWILCCGSSSSGNFAILSYAPDILKSSGITINPEILAIIIPAVMIVGSLMSVVVVERIGRKILLSVTFVTCALAMFLIGSIILVQQRGGNVPTWLPLLCISSFSIAYAGGVSSMPYVITSEMFPFEVRARISGCLTMSAWLGSCITLFVYRPLSNAFGTYTTFYVYTGINLMGAIVGIFFVPETKMKSVDEIQEELSGKMLILPTKKYYRFNRKNESGNRRPLWREGYLAGLPRRGSRV